MISRYENFKPESKLLEWFESGLKAEQSEQIKQAHEHHFSCYQNDDDMWVIRARLPAEHGRRSKD
jgi:hypothetical protein